MVDSQSHDRTTFPSSSVLDVSDVDGMAPSNSIEGDDGITSRASNNEQQWSDHSHFFFTAQQQARFWMASVIIAVVLHKLFRSSGRKELVAGNVLGSAVATAPVTAATNQGQEPNESNSLTSNDAASNDDPLTPSTGNLGQTILLHDASSHIHRDSNDKDCKKPTTSSRGKKSKKLIHKDAASIRNYDKLVTTCTVNEDENLSLSTPPMDKKQDFMASQTSTPISTQHASQQSNEPIPNSTGDNNETIYLHTKPHHPGLKGYHYWQSTINSLYRIYAVPHNSYPNDSNEEGSSNTSFLKAVLPMHPSSERGQVPIDLEVTNRTNHEVIHVFWMDYSGKEVYKGSMRRGETWNQTTYIGHPWIFRVGHLGEGGVGMWNDGNEESVLLKYVPFRVVPSIPGAETVNHPPQKNIHFHVPVVGMQRFTLRNVPEGYGLIMDGRRWKPACVVEDEILPEPPLVLVRSERRVNDPFAAECYDEWGHYNSNNPAQIEAYNAAMREIYTAIKWSCQQIEREEASCPGCGIAAIKRLRQYLSNISTHPNEPKYRKLRISNPTFQENVYNTGARGVLLALGFEEHCGYLECGAADGQMLTQDRIKMVSDAMVILSTAMGRIERQYESEKSGDDGDMQPIGADGFGRAGFGYAGSMNRFL